MNVTTSIDWTELSTQWILTCGHFLWQGLAVAFAFLLIERIASIVTYSVRSSTNQTQPSHNASVQNIENQASASVRYWLACCAFMSLPVCILLTFSVVHSSRGSFLKSATPLVAEKVTWQSRPSTGLISASPQPPNEHSVVITELHERPLVTSDINNQRESITPNTESLPQMSQFIAPSLSVLYASVVCLLLIRLSLSLFGSSRFKTTSQPITDPQLLRIITAQANLLKLRFIPAVATCVRVSSPVVVGIARPIILLPPSLLCGLDPTQVAAILSHEMAHIRRFDLIVNLIQRVLEALFFFHPVTWWLSRQISIERENCCDDVAASIVGRFTYAGALLQMASVCLVNNRHPNHELATLAADGGRSTDFGYRIRRLLDTHDSPQISLTKRTLTICLGVAALMWVSLVTMAQPPQSNTQESTTTTSRGNQKDDEIQWSTFGPNDGLLSGARLIIPNDGVTSGQPVVVEYRLKNVSSESKKLTCFIRGNREHLVIDCNNCICDIGVGIPDTSIEITIDPGSEYVANSHLATIDTHGLSPGKYQVALGSAFFLSDETNPTTKREIPHRGSVSFTIVGKSDTTTALTLDNQIQWGRTVSGLRLGAKFRAPAMNFAVGDVAKADLWIANVTTQPIEFSVRLPHPMDGWLFNIKNHLGENIMLERPPLISIPFPQDFYHIKLAPGEAKVLTSERIEGQSNVFACSPAAFEIVSKSDSQTWGDNSIRAHLVARGGAYSANINVLIDRPNVPGLHIELETGNCLFTVGESFAMTAAPRILDEETDRSILWGESSGGLRLGIKHSAFSRRGTTLRHGEHIEYEVWIKNETEEIVRIARDPRNLHRAQLEDNHSINMIGSENFMSFMIPSDELSKAELVLPPGHSARRFLENYHSASIRPPGSTRGKFGSAPLNLEPGKYTVYAQIGDLKSGTEVVEIAPASRLQIRKSSGVTEKNREYAAEDPSEEILSWQASDGEKHEAMINQNGGVMIDERDILSTEIAAVVGHPDQYAIVLRLRPESANWLSRQIEKYSLWDDPNMVAILLNGKPIGNILVPSPIPDSKLTIPVNASIKEAEALAKELEAAITLNNNPPAAPEPTTKMTSPKKGVELTGEVKMPEGDWLFCRQVKQLPDIPRQERPREFTGDSVDPEDYRLVHELSWKDVLSVHVTIKANDGRDYTRTIVADKRGMFHLSEPLPIGSYQIDADALLTADDDSQERTGRPAMDLRAATQRLRIEQGDAGLKSVSLELYPVPFSNRLRHADPAKRTTIHGKLTENNHPVPNARIILYGGLDTRWKIAEGLTDERGYYRFENVFGELIGFQVKHEKLVPSDGNNWRDIADLKFGTSHRLDLQMIPGGYISGQLRDNDEKPRAELPIRIMKIEPGIEKGSSNFVVYATTDVNGTFTSEPLPPGSYEIQENQNGYPVLGNVTVVANQTARL